jgi:hypothetical protein
MNAIEIAREHLTDMGYKSVTGPLHQTEEEKKNGNSQLHTIVKLGQQLAVTNMMLADGDIDQREIAKWIIRRQLETVKRGFEHEIERIDFELEVLA